MPIARDYTAIVSDRSWTEVTGTPTVVTYSFENRPQQAVLEGDESRAYIGSFQRFTSEQKELTRQALQMWDDASGLTFVEVASSQGDIRFGNYDFSLSSGRGGIAGYAYYPARTLFETNAFEAHIGGDVFIDLDEMRNPDIRVLAHEIGHAIGLEHSHGGDVTLPADMDNDDYTLMSYNSTSNRSLGPLDKDAVAHIYGPDTFSSGSTDLDAFRYASGRNLVIQSWGEDSSSISGTSLNDRISGGGGADSLGGFRGNDLLFGGAGNDRIYGGPGNDTLVGGAGDDFLSGSNAYTGFAGDSDTASYAATSAGMTATLGAYGSASGAEIGQDQLVNIDNLTGGSGADTLTGSDTANRLLGGAGDDTLRGEEGRDFLRGDAGDDVVYGGGGWDVIYAGAADKGADELYGGAGNDILGGGAGGDLLRGEEGQDLLFGGTGDDVIEGGARPDIAWAGSGADRVEGGGGADTLGGGNGQDTLFGGDGWDLIYAGQDKVSDQVYGGAGQDVLFGGGGDDLLAGGSDNDELYGGGGDDTFLFAAGHGADAIGGFTSRGNNVIDLSGLDLRGMDALEIRQQGEDVLIETGAGSIRLWNAEETDLGAEDFIF